MCSSSIWRSRVSGNDPKPANRLGAVLRALYPLQVLVFRELAPNLVDAVEKVFGKTPNSRFVCILDPGEVSERMAQFWSRRIEPIHPHAHLHIFHASESEEVELIGQVVEMLHEKSPGAEIEVLYFSEVSGFIESRRLSRRLKKLTANLNSKVPECLIWRI